MEIKTARGEAFNSVQKDLLLDKKTALRSAHLNVYSRMWCLFSSAS